MGDGGGAKEYTTLETAFQYRFDTFSDFGFYPRQWCHY